MTTLIQVLSGRKRESGIWEYFTYKPDKDKSLCTVVDDKDISCGMEVAGKNATNLKSHVKTHHATVYVEFQKTNDSKHDETKKQCTGNISFHLGCCSELITSRFCGDCWVIIFI